MILRRKPWTSPALAKNFSAGTLPLILRPVPYLVPLTYGADMLKHAITQNGHLFPLISLAVLPGFTVLLFEVSKRNIKKCWIY